MAVPGPAIRRRTDRHVRGRAHGLGVRNSGLNADWTVSYSRRPVRCGPAMRIHLPFWYAATRGERAQICG